MKHNNAIQNMLSNVCHHCNQLAVSFALGGNAMQLYVSQTTVGKSQKSQSQTADTLALCLHMVLKAEVGSLHKLYFKL